MVMSYHLPLHWRLQPQRYRLQGTVCTQCGDKSFPPQTVCTACQTDAHLQPLVFQGKGTVASFTTVHTPVPGLVHDSPYVLAWVRLEEGPLLTTQLVDIMPGDVHVGMSVVLTTRQLQVQGAEGPLIYGYKFMPATTPTAPFSPTEGASPTN